MRWFRPLVYLWALPTTSVGLIIVALTSITGGRVGWHSGVLEASGGFAAWALRRLMLPPHGASAMALGHVVIARTPFLLDQTRIHERVHVRQAEWFGPFFIPAYFAASGIAWARGRRGYRDNWFERQAYDIEAMHDRVQRPSTDRTS